MAYVKTNIAPGQTISSTWGNNVQTQYDEAMKETELRDYKVYKLNKDAEGIYTTVEYDRQDGTLAIRSVLSGGTTPLYTTRTITYYDTDGTTLLKTTTRTLSYDADGVLTSEV
jgi:hypothetical protein